MIRIKGYNYTTNGYFEKYYEEKALEGYFIHKMHLCFIHVFKHDRQKKVKYKFEYFKEGSFFDSYDKQEKKEFIEQCEYYGWKSIYSTYNYQLFCDESNGQAKDLSIKNIDEINNSKKHIFLSILAIFMYMFIVYIGFDELKTSNMFIIDDPKQIHLNILMYISTIMIYGSMILDSINTIIFYLKNKDVSDDYNYTIKYNSPLILTIGATLTMIGLILMVYIFISYNFLK